MVATVTGIPKYMKTYQKDILKRASKLSKRKTGLPEYGVAGFSPYQKKAMRMAEKGLGAYEPMLQAGADTLGTAAGAYKAGLGTLDKSGKFFRKGSRALDKSQGRFTGQGFDRFMDPYLEQVVKAGQKDIMEQGAQAMNLERGRGLSAAALGGSSRANLEARKVGEQTAESAAELGSRLRSEGFRDAMSRASSAFESQKGRQQTAGQAFGNLGVGMTNMGKGIGALAGGLGNIGTSQAKLGGLAQQMGQSDVNMLYGMGANQQQLRQAQLDTNRMNQYQNYMQPYQQLGFFTDIFSGVPSSSMSFTMPQQPNPYSQIGGMMIGAGGTLGGYS